MKKKNNKGVTSTVILVIAGAIIFIIFIIVATNFANNLFKSFRHTDSSLKKFSEVVEEVAVSSESGSGKEVTLRLDKDSAIIMLNPEHDYATITNSANGYVFPASKFFQKPSSCSSDALCICACNELTYAKDSQGTEKIHCEETKCYNVKNARIPKENYAKDIFDFDSSLKSKIPDNFYDSLDYLYYDNSLFMPRLSSSLKDDLGVELYVDMGYFYAYDIDYQPENIGVFVKKVSNNPNVVNICFKDKCYEEANKVDEETELAVCPYDSCESIRDPVVCQNPKNTKGCESFLDLCNWDYPSSVCSKR